MLNVVLFGKTAKQWRDENPNETGNIRDHAAIYQLLQASGAKVCEEEKELTQAHKKGKVHGEKEVPVLFEEADGVYIKLQGKDRKKGGKNKAEMKIGIAYDSWKRTGK